MKARVPSSTLFIDVVVGCLILVADEHLKGTARSNPYAAEIYCNAGRAHNTYEGLQVLPTDDFEIITATMGHHTDIRLPPLSLLAFQF